MLLFVARILLRKQQNFVIHVPAAVQGDLKIEGQVSLCFGSLLRNDCIHIHSNNEKPISELKTIMPNSLGIVHVRIMLNHN